MDKNHLHVNFIDLIKGMYDSCIQYALQYPLNHSTNSAIYPEHKTQNNKHIRGWEPSSSSTFVLSESKES